LSSRRRCFFENRRLSLAFGDERRLVEQFGTIGLFCQRRFEEGVSFVGASRFAQQLGFGQDQLGLLRLGTGLRGAQQCPRLFQLSLLQQDLGGARTGRDVLGAGGHLAEMLEGKLGILLLLLDLAEEKMDGALVG
jgi:hypothetical protein